MDCGGTILKSHIPMLEVICLEIIEKDIRQSKWIVASQIIHGLLGPNNIYQKLFLLGKRTFY